MNCLQSSDTLSPIYLFQGEGIGEICLKNTYQMLQKQVEHPVFKIDYSYLIRNLVKGTFVMPGGNAVTQMNKICPTGQIKTNIVLKNVKLGHNYLGICAGAYLGTKYFSDLTNSTYSPGSGKSENQKIRFRNICTASELTQEIKTASVLYFGGPEFIQLTHSEKVLVSFSDSGHPAVIERKYDHSTVILMSYHPELTSNFPYQNFSSYLHPSFEESEFRDALNGSQATNESITSMCLSRLGLKIKEEEIRSFSL